MCCKCWQDYRVLVLSYTQARDEYELYHKFSNITIATVGCALDIKNEIFHNLIQLSAII